MPDVSFTSLWVITIIAFAMPLALGFAPGVRLPSVVLEIVAGIIIGPSVLGWARADLPVQILSTLGLAFLLFLAGLEIDVGKLRGRVLTVTGSAFALSFALALIAGFALKAAGQVQQPLFIAIVLAATALGVVIPILKDAGELSTDFGQLVTAAATFAEFGAIILLSLFFSGDASGIGTKLFLIGGIAVAALALALVITGAERSMRLSQVLIRLQDTTAQIRVRGAVLLLTTFAVIAAHLGLEIILGAFIAGAILTIVDPDRMLTHAQFRTKLEAIGFGLFIPVFFVTSGVNFNLAALFSSPATVARVPVFLVALLLVRGVPALLYRSLLDSRRTLAAALLQATSLSFIVAASQIGLQLKVLSLATSAALIAAGLLSVLIFPLLALTLLRGAGVSRNAPAAVLVQLPTPLPTSGPGK
jgi:Kef-type K+ transport system membrane component KefB